MDKDASVRSVFMSRQTEWEASNQANELREQFQPVTTQRVRKVL
jgi:hypothetical protein